MNILKSRTIICEKYKFEKTDALLNTNVVSLGLTPMLSLLEFYKHMISFTIQDKVFEE